MRVDIVKQLVPSLENIIWSVIISTFLLGLTFSQLIIARITGASYITPDLLGQSVRGYLVAVSHTPFIDKGSVAVFWGFRL
jgi:hypothetical protein